MSVKSLRKAGKKYGTRYAQLTVLSGIAATIVAAVVGAVADPRRVLLLPGRVDLPLFAQVWIQTFLVLFVGGLVGRVINQNSDKLRTAWSTSISTPLADRWMGLARRRRALIVGVLAAIVAGGISAVVGIVYMITPPQIVGICLVVWPSVTYGILQRRPSGRPTGGITRSLAVRSRYAELRQLETRTITLLVGFVLGATTGGVLWRVGVDTVVTVAIAVLVWLAATVLVYNRYESALTRRTELAIVDTETTADDEVIELSVTNRGTETVELTDATITDTTGRRYRLRADIALQPGGKTTVKLPATFVSSPTTAERELPLGYTLDRSQAAPIIYSRTGDAFELHGSTASETTAWPSATPDYAPQSTAGPETPQSQD